MWNHARRLNLFAPLATSTLLLACSGSDAGSTTGMSLSGSSTSSGTTSTGDGGAGGGVAADEFRFDTKTYSLQPGEEKRYFCYTTHLPAGKQLTATEIAPIYGKATHHIAIYTPIVAEPDGVFDCPELQKDTWIPIYVGGVDSTPLTAPAGAGFHLIEGQQVLVQLHLLNASNAVVEDKASVVFKLTEDANVLGAGMFGYDDRVVSLPAHSKGTQVTMTCPTGHDMDVFAVFGHMHQLGKHIEVSKGAVAGQNIVWQTDWNFNNQPTSPLQVHFAASDPLTIRCTYDNPGDADVTWGESSYQEMCSFVLYYTPFTGVDGCVKTTGSP